MIFGRLKYKSRALQNYCYTVATVTNARELVQSIANNFAPDPSPSAQPNATLMIVVIFYRFIYLHIILELF